MPHEVIDDVTREVSGSTGSHSDAASMPLYGRYGARRRRVRQIVEQYSNDAISRTTAADRQSAQEWSSPPP